MRHYARLAFEKFSEFANITLERITTDLVHEFSPDKLEIAPEDILVQHEGVNYTIVLRTYVSTTPGKRNPKHSTCLVQPEKNLNYPLNL